jgi:hypothetical protein
LVDARRLCAAQWQEQVYRQQLAEFLCVWRVIERSIQTFAIVVEPESHLFATIEEG